MSTACDGWFMTPWCGTRRYIVSVADWKETSYLVRTKQPSTSALPSWQSTNHTRPFDSVHPYLRTTGAPPPRAEAKAPVPTAAPAKKAPPPPRVAPASPPPPDDEKKGGTSPAGRSSPRPPPGKPQGGPTRATPPSENHLRSIPLSCLQVLIIRCCAMCWFNFAE